MNGFVVPKNAHLVFIFKNKEGDVIKRSSLPEGEFDRIHARYRFYGVFVNEAPDRIRFHDPEKRNENVYGVPEGYHIIYGKLFRSTGNILRLDYFYKLKRIAQKAKELMSLGIDKKTAYKAAMKCGCQIH